MLNSDKRLIVNQGRPPAYFTPISQATDLDFNALSTNKFANTFHSFNAVIICLFARMEKWTDFTFTVQREPATAQKCNAIDIGETKHTGNIRMENNRRLKQRAHNNPVANKIPTSLDHTLLSLKH